MRHYLDLVSISSKVHRKKSRMTRMCIVLAVFLVTTIFGMADMEIRSQKMQAVYSNGGWHASFKNITDEQAREISERDDVKYSSWYGVYNYGLDEGWEIDGVSAAICGMDDDFFEMFPSSEVVEGSYPENKNEVVLVKSAKERLGLQVGDTVTLTLPAKDTVELTVCGFTKDASMLAEGDAVGAFLNMDSYRELLPMENFDFYKSMFYIQFTPYCNIQKALSNICKQYGITKDQVGQNTKLLAMMLQSNDPYMMQLYATAAVLAALVTIAGILMITSSLSNNVAQQMEFFGMLRCLGATSGQIRRFVRKEALSWCKVSIPIGVSIGTLVVWGLCAILKFQSPSYFEGMPTFGVSWIGIFMGGLVGIVTVLLAAQSPAGKAAKVSPLTVVSGNAGTVYAVRKAASTNLFKVDTTLGIHHAIGNRKKFILTVSSFAFSIILFLAFNTAVDFMNHAITPLRPYTPDISIISKDNSCSIPKDWMQDLAENDAIKKVYGRKFAYNVAAKIDGQNKKINLISYDDEQFKWAKDSLLVGNVEETQNGTAFLAVYSNKKLINTKSSIGIYYKGEMRSIPISGILSTAPFDSGDNAETIICSEELFHEIFGQENYTIIDLQLASDATDGNINEIKKMIGDRFTFSDQRIGNDEAKGTYYSFALFIYGFLVIIALISIFNIVNSIAMGVSARIQQYGAMRAVGMSSQQLTKMVAAEAITYGIAGIVLGCAIGVPIHKLLFEKLVTFQWGDSWYLPVSSISIIVLVLGLAIVLAVYGPAKRIHHMSIVETINAE